MTKRSQQRRDRQQTRLLMQWMVNWLLRDSILCKEDFQWSFPAQMKREVITDLLKEEYAHKSIRSPLYRHLFKLWGITDQVDKESNR